MFFIFIPVGVSYAARRWPVITFVLMGLCTAIHLLSMVFFLSSPSLYQWWFETFWLKPSESTSFTYLSSMFVHADIFHLIGNMIYLFLFGACVEDLIGRGRYLVFYLGGGLLAAFGHIALTGEHFASEIPMGGASGAISACMGAFALLLWRTQIEFKYFGLFLFRPFGGEFHLPAWLVLSFWFLSDVFWALVERGSNGAVQTGTALGAHIGGFLTGMGVMALLKPKLAAEEDAEAEAEEVVAQIAARPTAPEPAAEPMYFISDNGQTAGPFPLERIWRNIEDGSLSREAFYWQEGMAEWRSVRELL